MGINLFIKTWETNLYFSILRHNIRECVLNLLQKSLKFYNKIIMDIINNYEFMHKLCYTYDQNKYLQLKAV